MRFVGELYKVELLKEKHVQVVSNNMENDNMLVWFS